MAAASMVMALLFTGNWLVARGLADRNPPTAETEITQTPTEETAGETAPETSAPEQPTEETVEETQPESTPPQEALLWQKLEAAVSDMEAGCVFVYDTAQERMLYCSTAGEQTLYPASITKLFSAYVALLYLEPEQVVTAGEELSLVQPGSSTAYISRGCRLTVEMLVEGMLLPSGNDAAYVLAAAAGRAIAVDPGLSAVQAVQVFVAEMNREAYRLGLKNSRFTNPDGYHAGGHYTCPDDIALIAALAMREPTIARYAGLQQDQVTFESGEWITWYNTNGLLDPSWCYYIPTALGMKTGYTSEAGYCLLAAFPGGGEHILIGVFGGATKNGRYAYAGELLDVIQGR